MAADMGPSRHPVGPEVPATVSYEHIRTCAHCGRGGDKQRCPGYQAIVRDFSRNRRVLGDHPTPALGVESMADVVEGGLR